MISLVAVLFAAQIDLSIDDVNTVKVTLTNNDTMPMVFMMPQTPFSEMEENVFTVIQNATQVEFVGKMVRWATEEESVQVTVNPGEHLKATINIGKRYDIETGTAQVQLDYFMRTKSDGQWDNIQIKSNIVDLQVVKHHKMRTKRIPDYNFYNCDKNDAMVKKALDVYFELQQAAIDYLEKHRHDVADRKISNYLGNNKNAVQAYYIYKKAIGFKFDVTCAREEPELCEKPSIYAFVYPHQPMVYLCAKFFSTGVKGYDSKGGVFSHEVSHFNRVAGTVDFVYTPSKAKTLAEEEPQKAIKNADNYEYFAESVLFKLK